MSDKMPSRPMILLAMIADLDQEEFSEFMHAFRAVMMKARAAADREQAARDAQDAEFDLLDSQLDSAATDALAAIAKAGGASC